MTEQELSSAIQDLQRKVDAIYTSTEKTRKYFLWTLIISVVVFVLPLLGLLFAVPSFLSSYTSALGDPDAIAAMQAQLTTLGQ